MSATDAVTMTLRLGSRSSPLARAQVAEAMALMRPLLPRGIQFNPVWFGSPGDRNLDVALDDPSIPDDFFTRDLDDALRAGAVDLTVHSAKDLPQRIPDGLQVAALLPARDIRDALVVRESLAVEAIRTVGTSSPRREKELRRCLPRARPKPIRGTIEGRLAQLDAGEFDAVIVAACALYRLGLESRLRHFLPYDAAPQQGRLALVTRGEDHRLTGLLRALDIRIHSGLVVYVPEAALAAAAPPAVAAYTDAAQVIFNAPDGAGGPRHRALSDNEHSGHAELLAAAETGALVVRVFSEAELFSARIVRELRFLEEWNLRQLVLSAQGAPERGTGWTLFTGLDPANFHACGPLLHQPMIEVEPVPLAARSRFLALHLAAAAGVLFPSRPAVRTFLEALGGRSGVAALEDKVVLAVGPATARELLQAGVRVDLSAPDLGGVESLVARLETPPRGRFLYPCSSAAPQEKRTQAMLGAGVEIHPEVFYQLRPSPMRPLARAAFERVVFTSPSTVDAYFTRYPTELKALRQWLAIGPSTQQALERHGLDAVRLRMPG